MGQICGLCKYMGIRFDQILHETSGDYHLIIYEKYWGIDFLLEHGLKTPPKRRSTG